MSDDGYSAKDALLVAQIGGLRAEERPDEELCQGYMELVSLRLEHGRLPAARAAVEELLAFIEQRPSLVIERIRAEYMGALVALELGDAARAIAHCEWAVERTLELELEADVPHMQLLLAKSLALAGKNQEASQKLEEALERFESSDQPEYAALSALQLSGALEPEKERSLLDRALVLAKASGSARALGVSSLFRGAWHASRDEYLPARQLLERSLSLLAKEDDAQEEVTCALTQLTWLHVRAFALDEAEARSTELLARSSSDPDRADALEARGMARQRLHRHALARSDLAAAARALWACGSKSRAVTFWARAVLNQILVWLHALRLLRPAPLRDTASESRELIRALLCYIALAFVWSMVCIAVGGLAKPLSPRLIPVSLLIIGCLPMLLLFVAVAMDIRQALRQARERGQRS